MIKEYTIFFLAAVGLNNSLHAQTDSTYSPVQLSATQVASAQCIDLANLRSQPVSSALIEFYEQSNYTPFWQDDQRLDALQKQLLELGDDGLIVADYSPALQTGIEMDLCQELRLSSYYLLALEHLSLGRLPQQSLEPQWQSPSINAKQFDLVDLAARGRDNMAGVFDLARPELALYRDLRTAFAQMDKQPPAGPAIPGGPVLRLGMTDSRVSTLADRLKNGGYLVELAPGTVPGSSVLAQLYDARLQEAVRQFQDDMGLEADGIIGPLTIAALNITPAQRVQQVRINLERLRWLNAQRDDYLLLVNIAGGHIRLYRGDAIIWQARTQSGRASRPTPAIVSSISRITLNPSWTVPPTILVQDALPQIRRSLDYLAEHNMQVLDSQGNPVNPLEVDWNRPNGLILRQTPGPTNPLGQMVFRLDNPFSVFLHDTPRQDLFDKAARNVSSGCVRVEDTEGLAGHLLAYMTAEQRDRIEALQNSGNTHEVNLQNGPQLILGYWTAEAGGEEYEDKKAGDIKKAVFMPDPYGLDQTLIDTFIDLDGRSGFQFQ